MDAIIRLTYHVALDEEDTVNIELGNLNPNDIDVAYYIDNPACVDDVDVEIID